MAKRQQSTATSKTAGPAARPRRRQPNQKTKTTPATQLEVETPDPPPVFDVVGEDDRRLARSWSRDACKELQQRVVSTTGEKTRIVPASPFAALPS